MTDAFKTDQNERLKKTAEATCDLFGNKVANTITKVSKIQKQLKMSMIKKYLKKDIYLQKKDKKLLIV